MTRGQAKLILVIVLAVVLIICALFITRSVMQKRAEKELASAVQAAYEKGLAENEPVQTIIIEPEDDHIAIDVATLREIIAPASELVSCKYFYTDSGVYEKNSTFFNSNIVVPFSTDKTVFTYSGTISAGIDLSAVVFDVNEELRQIKVMLPAPKILYNEIDANTFQYFDVKNSIFQSSSLGDYTAFVDALKVFQANKLQKNDEFWKQTRQSVQATLAEFLLAADAASDYTVSFSWSSK